MARTKKELLTEAKEKGLDVNERMTRDKLQEKLGELLPTAGQRQDLPFILSDQEDDNQILAELEGKLMEEYVYQFTSSGKKVVGLSKSGVDQVCRESANRRGEVYRIIDQPMVEDEGDYLRIIIKAGRYKIDRNPQTHVILGEILLDTAIGTKRQWKKQKLRSGQIVADPFYFEKAVTKAQRNAKMSLLPYKLITEMIKIFQGEGKVKQLDTPKYLSEDRKKWLYAELERLGVSKEDFKFFVSSRGYKAINEILDEHLDSLLAQLKGTLKPKADMPEDLFEWFIAAGISMEPRMVAEWDKFMVGYKDPIIAKEKLIMQLKRRAKEANNG